MKKNLFNQFVCGLVSLTVLASCCQHKKEQPDALVTHIDSTGNAGDDFFQYANGKWFKQNAIPASEQSNGIWQLINDTINQQILHICQSAAGVQSAEKGSNKQKIGDFFYSGMDSTTLNRKGLSDLKEYFSTIDRIANMKDLVVQSAKIQRAAASPLFGMYIAQDEKNSSKYAVHIGQGGLSMPDRSYYLDMDPKSKEIRASFVQYATNLFKIMGYDATRAGVSAYKLLEMETAMARTSRKREDLRDPFSNYHKMAFSDFSKLAPALDWALFCKEFGLAKIDTVIVGQPEFLTALNGYLSKYPMEEWKNYLKFHFTDGLTSYLDDKTYMESFRFYSAKLNGIKEPKPRWKRVVGQTDGSLGELVGQVYVAEYLPKGTKEKLLEIGNAIKTVFAERIRALDWMSETTKQKALKKLNAVIMKVGYPDKWKDLSKIQVDRTSYVKNQISVNEWAVDFMINKLGKPVNRTEWDMQPQTYNAYYNPSNNEIVIPGCNIIVPGYEGRMADDALLYAIIGGSTFGHEITHGFDDQGSKFDENGNLANWWTPEDNKRFRSKTKMIVEQFNNYVAVDNLHINGELTQGENIADLGGIVMGFEAFKKTKQYKNNEIIAGLTPTQRYFLGYSLAWMVNMRPEAVATQVKGDEHSPAKWRVIGPLSNMPEFYKAFGVKKGNKMWRSEKEMIKIW